MKVKHSIGIYWIYIKNVEELKNEIQQLKEMIIQKLIDNKIVFEFFYDKEIASKILQKALELDIR